MRQEGKYVKWAQLLQAAEDAPDSQERILGVCRLMLCFCTDVLRPSDQFANKPSNIFERHQVHRSQLGADIAQTQLNVHEVCSYDSNVAFWQPQAATGAFKKLAEMQMVLQPAVSVKSNRFSSNKFVKIKLLGTCTVDLGEDQYNIALPKFTSRDPGRGSSELQLAGYLSIACAATGLSISLSFKDKRAVEGQVVRQTGPRRTGIAHISGVWSEQIQVQCPAKQEHETALEGVLFDCHEYGGAISSQVNLQQLGGMQLAGLWSCIYDAMRYSKDVNTVPNQGFDSVSAKHKKAAKGWYTKSKAVTVESAEQIGKATSGTQPPCIQAEAALGKQLRFAVRCSIDQMSTHSDVTF